MASPFFTNSLKQSQQLSKEDAHSPVAPRDSGTPIRESRKSEVTRNMQRRMTNAETPTLDSTIVQAPVFKQSSFGSVIYDSNRKTREAIVEEDRHRQASSLSPTRLLSDMSRQDATYSMSHVNTGLTSNSLQQPSSGMRQLPSFGGWGAA